MIGERKLSIVLVAGLALAGCVAAWAQEAGPSDTGPVRFSVDLIGSYTDNRDSSANAESTFDFYFQPRIDATARWADAKDNGSAVFYYAPAYRYRTDPSPLENSSSLFHDVGIELRHGLSEIVKLRLNEYFNYTDDPSVQEGGETLRSDSSFILNRVDGGVTYAFSRRASIDLHAQNMLKRYGKEEVAINSDEDSTGGGATLWGQLSKSVGVLAQGELTQYGYDNSSGIERGFKAWNGNAGVETVFSPNFRMGLRGGIQSVEYDDSSLETETVPYGNLSATVAPIPVTRFTAGVTYSIRNSDVFPFASQKSTDLTGEMQWDASSKVLLGLGVAYRLGEYSAEGLPSSAGSVATGNRDAFYATAAATLKIDTETSLKLAQTYEDVSSDVSESFTKNTTALYLSRIF